MKIVLDASAAVSAVMDDESNVIAILGRASEILAPSHYIAEVTSGLWKYVTLRGLQIEEAARRLEIALQMIVTYHDVKTLAKEVLREACARRHPVYDLYYAVLARRENAAILTFDRCLKQLCTTMRVPLADA